MTMTSNIKLVLTIILISTITILYSKKRHKLSYKKQAWLDGAFIIYGLQTVLLIGIIGVVVYLIPESSSSLTGDLKEIANAIKIAKNSADPISAFKSALEAITFSFSGLISSIFGESSELFLKLQAATYLLSTSAYLTIRTIIVKLNKRSMKIVSKDTNEIRRKIIDEVKSTFLEQINDDFNKGKLVSIATKTILAWSKKITALSIDPVSISTNLIVHAVWDEVQKEMAKGKYDNLKIKEPISSGVKIRKKR